MKYRLHDNGWTVLLDNFNFKNATQSDADEIAKLISSNIVVVASGPNIEQLTPEDQVNFCSLIGAIKTRDNEDDDALERAIVLGSDNVSRKIHRVTGELNAEGHPGLFGHNEELSWHNNRPWDPRREPIVWLKSVRGAEGSRTSWTNTILAYNDLKKEDPNFIEELERKNYRIVCGWKEEDGHTTMYKYWNQFGITESEIKSEDTALPLIFENETGHKGFFLPFYQTFNFHGLSREDSLPIMEKIWNFCLQDKYIYQHDWKPGCSEIVIAEQWNSVHKRDAFEHMNRRVMHRIAVNYSNTSWWLGVKDTFNLNIRKSIKQNIKNKRS
jgi:alpha-ketoglutarate-dependent taurine dioxygenase